MREIKFRAWDNKNRKWLLGYEYPNLGGFSLTGECILFGEFASLFHPLERLKEIEIMQYTGLKDKNEKEIYEGDIVACYYLCNDKKDQIFKKGEVKIGIFNLDNGEFDEDICGVIAGEDYYLTYQMIKQEVKIIGNIYENPELLK